MNFSCWKPPNVWSFVTVAVDTKHQEKRGCSKPGEIHSSDTTLGFTLGYLRFSGKAINPARDIQQQYRTHYSSLPRRAKVFLVAFQLCPFHKVIALTPRSKC